MTTVHLEQLMSVLDLTPMGVGERMELSLGKLKIDSRQVGQGDLYLPIIGERFDGHAFILESIGKGASLAFCQRDYYAAHRDALEDSPLILVDDTLETLQGLARWVIQESGARVIAVTGSTGKTTTKDLIAHVLEPSYVVTRTQGNHNNHIGLPLTVLGATEGTEVFVLEMGMNHFGEIARLIEIAKPEIAVITNIGTSHIEHLGSREGILKAKLEITHLLGPEDLLILNGADPLLRSAAERPTRYDCWLFDTEEADYLISGIGHDPSFCHHYTLNGPEGQLDIELGIPGRHNVFNSAIAALVGLRFKVDPEQIQRGIRTYGGEKMRLHLLQMDGGYQIINDAYNASVDSMCSSLDMLAHFEARQRLAFLGDMFEMGTYALEGHRLVADCIDLDKLDYFFSIGELAIHIGARLIERGFDSTRIRHFDSFDEAAGFIRGVIGHGDVLLIKGSRGMAMETVIDKLQERGAL